MNPIRYVYYYFDNMYHTKSIYRLDVYTLEFVWWNSCEAMWRKSCETPEKLEFMNGKPRILKQLPEWSFNPPENIEESFLVMMELIT